MWKGNSMSPAKEAAAALAITAQLLTPMTWTAEAKDLQHEVVAWAVIADTQEQITILLAEAESNKTFSLDIDSRPVNVSSKEEKADLLARLRIVEKKLFLLSKDNFWVKVVDETHKDCLEILWEYWVEKGSVEMCEMFIETHNIRIEIIEGLEERLKKGQQLEKDMRAKYKKQKT